MAVDLKLKNMYTHEFEKIVDNEMQAPLKHLEKELLTIRTGRAHASMIEDVKVICYGGSQLSLRELAAISVPEPRMLVVQPWDQSIIADIEKALTAAPLGITPTNEGTLIRIVLPELSSQRRDELVKVLSKKLEDCKERIRVIRGEIRNQVKESERKREISEDFSKTLQDMLQKLTDKFNETIQKLGDKKEKEITSI